MSQTIADGQQQKNRLTTVGEDRKHVGSSNHLNTYGHRLVAEKRRKDLKYGDEEYQKKLDFISMIPSNKFDAENLKNLSDDAMNNYNEKHLRDLREQVMGYDEEELEVVAEAITERGWTFTYNAIGNYFDRVNKQREAIKEINQ